MRKPKVYVTRVIPSPCLKIISKYCQVELNKVDAPPERSKLLTAVRDKDALVCLLTESVDEELLKVGENLKVISSYSVGYDHIDVPAATKHGVYVTNTPGVLTEATADLTWALLMTSARRVVEAESFLRQGKWVTWTPNLMVGDDVHHATLGIIGLGRIGQAVARRAKGFDMKLLYFDMVRQSSEIERELGIDFVELPTLLAEADFVTAHVPLSKETYHLINEKSLKLMKPTAYLVNTSRGPVVDQMALAKALREKWIAGAALDVFEKEPISMDDPLLSVGNLTLVPHIGSATKKARSMMAELAANNLIAVLMGKLPPSLVNPEVQSVRPLHRVKMI